MTLPDRVCSGEICLRECEPWNGLVRQLGMYEDDHQQDVGECWATFVCHALPHLWLGRYLELRRTQGRALNHHTAALSGPLPLTLAGMQTPSWQILLDSACHQVTGSGTTNWGILRAPILIALKAVRFAWIDGGPVKLNDPISASYCLKVPHFAMVNGIPTPTGTCSYRLQALIIHHGREVHAGHYTMLSYEYARAESDDPISAADTDDCSQTCWHLDDDHPPEKVEGTSENATGRVRIYGSIYAL